MPTFYGRTLRKWHCGYVLAGATASMLSTMADAQGVPANSSGIEDIVVTAQRREQRLQDVPIAIAAVTSQSLEQYNVTGTLDLSRAVPGFLIQQRNQNATPFLRGLGNENGSPGDEPSVAVYVDGVYRASSSASTFSLNNVERIEVLKGPQGTLFGRNATAGVVNIITRDPAHDPAAELRVGYGNYDTRQASAYITGGLTSSLAADLSVYYNDQRDGWGKNIATGKDAYKQNSIALRSKWKLDLGPTTLTAIGDWSRDRFIAGPGTNPGMLEGQRSHLDGNAYFAGIYNINSDISPYSNFENYGVSLRIDHDFDWARLVSISAYRKVNASLYADSDATPMFEASVGLPGIQAINFRAISHDRQFSQELQLLSPGGSSIQWILGAFFLKAKQSPISIVSTPAATTRNDTSLPNQSLAVFGQTTLSIFDDTNLTLGLRYSVDKRGRSRYANGVLQNELFPNKEWKKPTWRIALDHKFSPDVMGYVSYNRGYKAGLYENQSSVRPPINPQTVDAFELGLKTQLFDRHVTFNAAAFHYLIKDFQLSATAPGGVTQILFNAAKARINGIDFELTARPVPRLQLTASGTFLDTKFLDFPNAPGFVTRSSPPAFAGWGRVATTFDASGLETNNSPKSSINLGAKYDLPLNDDYAISLNASDSYTSKYFISVDHLNSISSRHLVNASLTLSPTNDRWDVRLWVQNLLDKKYYVLKQARPGGDVGVAGAPLTYGVTFGLKM